MLGYGRHCSNRRSQNSPRCHHIIRRGNEWSLRAFARIPSTAIFFASTSRTKKFALRTCEQRKNLGSTSKRLNFASKSSKDKILRAVKNFNGPFITPIRQQCRRKGIVRPSRERFAKSLSGLQIRFRILISKKISDALACFIFYARFAYFQERNSYSKK